MALVALVFLLYLNICFDLRGLSCLSRPSYISDWHRLDTGDLSALEVTIPHDLGEMPAYCDVQVRSPRTGYIFPGIGSGFVDDDRGTRGGVLFYYNSDNVVLKVSHATDYVILTGGPAYVADNAESNRTADVRVRLWRLSDFPPPNQVIDGISITSSTDRLEESHNLNTVPMMTVVQLYMTDGPVNGLVTQAQGSYADNSDSNSGGGVVFAVSATDVKIWKHQSAFSYCDGWGALDHDSGSSCNCESADVVIYLWRCLESNTIFSNTISHSIFSGSEPVGHQVSITSQFDHDNDFIIVRAEITSGGDHVGYFFDGLGAALTDTTSSSPSDSYYTGGFIYATRNASQALRLWHPLFYSSCSSCTCIVKAPGVCGKTVTIHIMIVEGMSTTFHDYSPFPPNAYISDRKACYIQFACNSSVPLEPMESYYEIGGWTGDPPNCVICDTIESGANAILQFHPDMYRIAYHTCKPDYNLVSGDLNRTCIMTGLNTFQWNGTEPVCQAKTTSTSTTTTTSPTTTTSTSTTSPTSTTSTTSTSPTTTTTTTTPASTPTMTSAPSPVCFNITVTSSPEEIEEAEKVAEEISKNLTVEPKTTRAFQRSLTSARDSRVSAFFVGLIGYLVFGIVFGILFILDMMSLVKFYLERQSRHNQTQNMR